VAIAVSDNLELANWLKSKTFHLSAEAEAVASNSNLRWLRVSATRHQAFEKSFSRAFCGPDFGSKIRSWKRQEESRSVKSAGLRAT
jgi:hypothetical protein